MYFNCWSSVGRTFRTRNLAGGITSPGTVNNLTLLPDHSLLFLYGEDVISQLLVLLCLPSRMDIKSSGTTNPNSCDVAFGYNILSQQLKSNTL